MVVSIEGIELKEGAPCRGHCEQSNLPTFHKSFKGSILNKVKIKAYKMNKQLCTEM